MPAPYMNASYIGRAAVGLTTFGYPPNGATYLWGIPHGLGTLSLNAITPFPAI